MYVRVAVLMTAVLSLSACARPARVAVPIAPGAGRLELTVSDSLGRPVKWARISVNGLALTATTDSAGRASLDIPAGTHILRYRGIGYASRSDTVRIRNGRLHARRAVMRVMIVHFGPTAEQVAKSQASAAAVGRIDSIAEGAVRTDSSTTETYAALGTALLRAQVRLQGAGTSTVVSPLSVGQALSLVAAGAVDSTAWQLRPALRTRDTSQAWLGGSAARTIEAFSRRTDAQLLAANALWVTDRYQLEAPFVAVAREQYRASVRREKLDSSAFVQRLNAWADSATRGMIKEVLQKPFDTMTVAVLSNAVYFKGSWLTPFDSARTAHRPFVSGAGRQLQVPMLQRTAPLAYRRDSGLAVVRIPYRAGGVAMYVVLPDSGTDIGPVLDRIARNGWPMPDPRRETIEVDLELPRMRLTSKLDLAPPLTAIGMGIVFDSLRGDLSGIYAPPEAVRCPPLSSGSPAPDGCQRVIITKATHDAVVDVNESGTEAAAVTVVAIGILITSAPPAPQPFHVDRPFLFAIRDERSGAMLFMAYVAEPAP